MPGSVAARQAQDVLGQVVQHHLLGDRGQAHQPGLLRIHAEEFFGHQPTGRDALPNPEPLLENLTRCVIEILAGARDLEQIARWVTDLHGGSIEVADTATGCRIRACLPEGTPA